MNISTKVLMPELACPTLSHNNGVNITIFLMLKLACPTVYFREPCVTDTPTRAGMYGAERCGREFLPSERPKVINGLVWLHVLVLRAK